MAITGNARVIEYRKTPGAGAWTTLSGVGSGLGEIGMGEQTTIAEIQGEGEQTTRKALSVKNATFTVSAQKTDSTRTCFGTFRRQRIEFRVSPEGLGSGKNYRSFIVYVFARIGAAVNALQTYELTMTVDGGVTRGSH